MTKIDWNPKELALLQRIGVGFDPAGALTSDQLGELAEEASMYFQIDENDEPTEQGLIVEGIMDKLADVSTGA